jgi:hypothetical protein
MIRRYMVSMPVPSVGSDVLYRGPRMTAAEGPWPAKVTRVRRPPTEADPFGAVADLVVWTRDGTVFLEMVRYGRDVDRWCFPPPRPDHITTVVDEDDEAPGEASRTPDAPEWYRQFLQGH